MKVRIEDYYDGFGIIVTNDDGVKKTFLFDQEDNREGMVELFNLFPGVHVEYEEVC